MIIYNFLLILVIIIIIIIKGIIIIIKIINFDRLTLRHVSRYFRGFHAMQR